MHCTHLEMISLTYRNDVRQFYSQLDNRLFTENQILILLSVCLNLNNYYSNLYYSSIILLTWMKILLIYSRVNETRIRIFQFKYVLHWWILIIKMAWANQQLIFLIWSQLETEQIVLALTYFNGAIQLINQ